MVFSMANGFERMLKQMSRKLPDGSDAPVAGAHQHPKRNGVDHHQGIPRGGPETVNNHITLSDVRSQHPDPAMMHPQHVMAAQEFSPNGPPTTGMTPAPAFGGEYPISNISDFSYGSWGFQDEELWSLGLGYDLLAPSEQGLPGSDMASRGYPGQAVPM